MSGFSVKYVADFVSLLPRQAFQKAFTCAGHLVYFRFATSRRALIGCLLWGKGGTWASVERRNSMEFTSVTAKICHSSNGVLIRF